MDLQSVGEGRESVCERERGSFDSHIIRNYQVNEVEHSTVAVHMVDSCGGKYTPDTTNHSSTRHHAQTDCGGGGEDSSAPE